MSPAGAPEGPVSRSAIAADLRAIGLVAGDAVLVHSAMSRIGRVEGGAGAVVDAFLEVLGPAGTLAAPTLPFSGSLRAHLESDPVFEAEATPSRMGAISEAVRTHPAAVRSLLPTHPVAAIGPAAEFLCEDHLNARGPCDEHSPYFRLTEVGGKVLLLGVDFSSCTLLHTAEELARVPFIDFETQFRVRGRARGIDYTAGINCHSAPLPANFTAIEEPLRTRGLLTTGHVGAAECRLARAADILTVALALLRDDPYFLRSRIAAT
jgi:aminoglycoside 3-N-acetyltransferase